jgi:hypothetical protein
VIYLDVSMSVDGFIADPRVGADNPLRMFAKAAAGRGARVQLA